jgi:membrane protease YdiL (CAAX protease family)
MNDHPEREYFETGEDEAPLTVLPVRKKGWPWLAWPVILLGVAAAVLNARLRHEQPAAEDAMEDVIGRMQARYAVGAARSSLGVGQGGAVLLEQLKGLNAGTVSQRLRFVVLAGELVGPKEALKYLGELRQGIKKEKAPPAKEQAGLLDIMERLYRDYAQAKLKAPSVSPKERQELVRRLDWFGELALAPGGSQSAGGQTVPPPNPALREQVLAEALRTFWTTFLAFLGGLGLGLVGFVGLILFIILAAAGKVQSGLPSAISHGGVYAETFALWMVFFGGLGFALGRLVEIPDGDKLFWQAGVMFLSLAVLAWPVVRGIPWTQVRQDLGWTLGRRPMLEPALGVGCYLMSLPLLAVALALVLGLMFLERFVEGGDEGGGFGPVSRAAHPIVQDLAHGDAWQKLKLLFLASVAAPIVEETMFRGVLYRHLREASRRCGTFWSFLASATVVSFLFAVIHPQGLIAVPLLMALAYGFALAREWRGSLLPCMVGHGLNNGLVLLFAILAMGD